MSWIFDNSLRRGSLYGALLSTERFSPRRLSLYGGFLSMETFSLRSGYLLEETLHEALLSLKNLSTGLLAPRRLKLFNHHFQRD